MAVVPICYKMYYKDQTYPDQNIISPNKRCFLCECIAKPDAPRCFSSTINVRQNRRIGYSPASVSTTRTRSRGWLYASQGGCKGNTNEEQLRSLESYFGRLQGNTNEHQSDSSMSKTQLIDTGQLKSKNGLDSLDAYFDKLNEDADYDKDLPPTFDEEATKGNLASTPLPTQISVQDDEKKLKTYVKLGSKFPESTPKTPQQQDDEASDLHLISILASINIAVFLFEIASPVRNYEMELFSVPSLYGAKINELIMVGEWWRLVTPMFLHSGIFHIVLGCWALLTFGWQVCRGYGSFTFFLIYILGGVSGNLTSFLHTPEPTVGGTGPVFAIIGACLMYQIHNKDVIAKDVSDSMFQKAIITTGISIILSYVGPIDDWTHFGAALTGLAYGFFTSPTLQLDEVSAERGQEEGITLVRKYADPCKSLIIFTIFILLLSSSLFFVEPPLHIIASKGF